MKKFCKKDVIWPDFCPFSRREQLWAWFRAYGLMVGFAGWIALVNLVPGWSEALQLELSENGRYLTFSSLWTGHWVHWDFNHFFWDFTTYVIFTTYLAYHQRRTWWWSQLLAPPLISLVLVAFAQNYTFYRGLSAVDFVLVVEAGFVLLRGNGWYPKAWGFGLIFGSLVKLVVEWCCQSALICQSDLFSVAFESHLAGWAVGFILGGWFYLKAHEEGMPIQKKAA